MTQLSPDQMMELMAYADGELDGDDALRVEALLAGSEEARSVLATMQSATLGAVGAWLSRAADEGASKAGADGIADAVMLKIAAPERKVVPMRRRGGAVAAAAVGVLALAAAGLLWMRTANQPSTQSVVAQAAPSGAPAVTGDEPQGIEVDEVEAPARDVSVYYIDPAAAQKTSTVVIWIGDDSQKKAP